MQPAQGRGGEGDAPGGWALPISTAAAVAGGVRGGGGAGTGAALGHSDQVGSDVLFPFSDLTLVSWSTYYVPGFMLCFVNRGSEGCPLISTGQML
jgi:hypothetical protein